VPILNSGRLRLSGHDDCTHLRDVCRRDGVEFFFKQWGGPRPKSGGRLLDGEEWNGFPWQIVPDAILSEMTM